MFVITDTATDRHGVLRAVVSTVAAPDHGIVVQRTINGWEPLYAIVTRGEPEQRDLPSCFELSQPVLRALDDFQDEFNNQ
jgi:hypothetical protein